MPNWDAGSYHVTFAASQRYGSSQDFQVQVDGAVVATFHPQIGFRYLYHTTPAFTVAAGSHTITFETLNTQGGDNSILIDGTDVIPATPGVPVVDDPSFEQAPVGAGSYSYNPNDSYWDFEGTAGVSGDDSLFTGANPDSPSGTHVGFLQGQGSLIQAVVDWSSADYQVSFSAAQRYSNSSAIGEDFEVLLDGVVVGTFTPTGTSYQTYTTTPFAVTAGTHSLGFLGLDSAGGDNTAFIDAVQVVASDSGGGGGDDDAPTPVITSPASASPSDVIASTTQLSVGATVDGDSSNLIYSWSVEAEPVGAFDPQLSDNGSNEASNVTATFSSAGSYTFLVTVDNDGSTATSEVTVTVDQTVTSILVSPATPFVKPGTQEQLSAVAEDQFGDIFDKPPTFAWSVASGSGSVNSTGLYTVPKTGFGEVAIQVSAGNVSAMAPLEVYQQSNLINFDDLAAGTIVTNQYPDTTFSGDPAFPNKVIPSTDASQPNSIGAATPPPNGDSSGNPYNHPLYIDFPLPVNDLQFLQMRDNADSGATIGQVRVFVKGELAATIPMLSTGDVYNPGTVDISKYEDVTRIEIINITDYHGLLYDDFRFTPDPLDLTAYQTGDSQGQPLPDGVKASGDPTQFLVPVDNFYQKSDGTPALDSTTADIPNGPGSGDDSLAKITLQQLPSGVTSGKVRLVLSDPGAVRLFKPDGTLFYDGSEGGPDDLTTDAVNPVGDSVGVLTLDVANPSGYLAGLLTGNLDLYVEAEHQEADFDLAYLYKDSLGHIITQDNVNMELPDLVPTIGGKDLGGKGFTAGITKVDATHYKITNDLPVGEIVSLLEKPSRGLTPATITWGGGTDVSGYFSDPAKTPATLTGGPTRAVISNLPNYKFVLDATAKTYTITLSMTYKGRNRPTPPVTLTFDAIRPKVATLTISSILGTPTIKLMNGFVGVALVDPNNSKKGMGIVANTTNDKFGGSFMFMQLIDTQRTKVVGGVTSHMRNLNGGMNLDNSYPGENGGG